MNQPSEAKMFKHHVKTEDGQVISVDGGLVKITSASKVLEASLTNDETILLAFYDKVSYSEITINVHDLANLIYFLRKSHPKLDLRLD